jgi:hypothetical protein
MYIGQVKRGYRKECGVLVSGGDKLKEFLVGLIAQLHTNSWEIELV